MKHPITPILLTVVLTGCTTPGGGLLNTNIPADAGAAPIHYEQVIKNYLRLTLKDPSSVMDFAVGDPTLTSCAVGVYGPFHGWQVPAVYNAKNSFGAYTGLQQTFFWFHNERLAGVSSNRVFCPEASGWKYTFGY